MLNSRRQRVNRRGRRRPGLSTRRGRVGLAVSIALVLSMALVWPLGRCGWQRSDSGPSPSVSSGPVAELSVGRPATGLVFDPPRSQARFELARAQAESVDPSAAPRLVEWRDRVEGGYVASTTPGPVRVEYSLDEVLTARIFQILKRGRVSRGHVIVLDPRDGRLLAYVSTDEERLPPGRAYPAASIVKILTAAAVLEQGVGEDESSCVYRGNKYRLNRRRLDRPKQGREASLETALASSNNQCFAQWALHTVGETRLRETFERFGWLAMPAPGHEEGQVEPLETPLDLGRMGSGLDGVRVTPLHVAQLASILTHGDWVEPWWVDRVVDVYGVELPTALQRPNRRVLSKDIAQRLRLMLVATTKRGTARSAFRDRRGRPRLGSIDVAGKTGNLSGRNPSGRYEWFLGLAPAQDPKIAVVVLQLQGHMWWRRSTELAADVLQEVFCDTEGCSGERADRWTGDLGDWATPLLVSELGRRRVVGHSD